MIHILIDGKRVRMDADKVNRQIVMAHSDCIDPSRTVLMLSNNDEPDRVLGKEYIEIHGGEQFVTLPPAAMGG